MRLSSLLLPTLLIALAAGCQPRLPGLPKYPDTSPPEPRVTTEGVVVSVERPRPEDSKSYVRLVIAPRGEQKVRLILAPGWFLDRHGMRFEPNEVVRAEGRREVRDGQASIVANRISTTRDSIELRDERDQPAWLH